MRFRETPPSPARGRCGLGGSHVDPCGRQKGAGGSGATDTPALAEREHRRVAAPPDAQAASCHASATAISGHWLAC
jgi:hypothetical protein